MPVDDILMDCELHMEKTLEHLHHELRAIRTGRASPALVEHIHVEYYGTPTPLKAIATDTMPPDFLIGTFKHADGRRAVMINNYHFAYTSWPTVEFDVPADKVVEVCQETGKEIPLLDDSPAMEGMQLSIDAGKGRLFLLPPQ